MSDVWTPGGARGIRRGDGGRAALPGAGLAVAAAFCMIAYQVGAKATRDALFLSSFPVSALPPMVIASALVSIALAFVAARALARRGPESLIPLAFAGSAGLLLVEWGLVGPWPRGAAVVVYLHYGGLGALLVSGFWAFLNERFDPRTAKRVIGRVAAGGTVGGLAGGALAGAVGSALPVATMLPLLAGFHLACAALVARLRRAAPPLEAAAGRTAEDDGTGGAKETGTVGVASLHGLRVLAASPYLRTLVLLVLLVTAGEGLIDWVFKARAASSMVGGEELLRLFAAFYTGVSLLTIVLQAALARPVLERMGPARTVAALPAVVGLGSLGAIGWPGLPSALGLRAAESVLGNSLYRGGYEVLFTPVAARERRAVKPIVDVGASRAGDFLGAGLVQVAVLVAGLAAAPATILVVAVLTSAGAVAVALRLHAGYVRALERGLLSRAVRLDLSEVRDATTRSTMLRSLGGLDLSMVFERPLPGRAPESRDPGDPAPPAPPDGPADPLAARAVELASGHEGRVRAALGGDVLPATLVPQGIALLAWDGVARDAIAALRRAGPPAVDALVAALTDATTDFTIRRRVPLALGTIPERAAVLGLLRGLSDRRFEVRYRCGRALGHLVDGTPGLTAPREVVLETVLREVRTERRVWDNQRILDQWDDDAWTPLADDALRTRANRSLEHVFTLLALVLPRQPLRVAYRGLHTDDALLRGTALEYLESSLPPEVRRLLWPYLDDDRPGHGASRSPEQALADLLKSGDSIRIRLDELRGPDA